MIKSNSQHRPQLLLCRLLTGLLLAAWLAPAAHGEGWPYWPFNKDDKPGKPDKIVTLWSDTVLTQTGRPPIRGFGGRLMFYEGKKEEPIKVEGTLVVYAFDETDRDANNSRPDRKYVITQQQLPAHYSMTKVGHSYSIWLPWDEAGGLQKEFTLIVRFQPKEGAVAVSEPCRELLPGRIAPPARAQSPVAPNPAGPSLGVSRSPVSEGAQSISYQAPITDGTDGTGILTAAWQQRHLTTTTIAVPSGSLIRAPINSPQVSPAAGGGYSPAVPGQAGPPPAAWQDYPPQNYPPRNSLPPGYTPPTATSTVMPGQQPRSGFVLGRQRPLGEPLVPPSRDRVLWPQHPAGSPSGLATPPGQDLANAGQAAPQGVPQSRN